MAKKRVVYFVILWAFLFVFGGCETELETANYSVSLTLSGASAYDGDTFGAALFDAGADPFEDDSVTDDGMTISGGIAEVMTTVTKGTYDLYAIIDEDNDDDLDAGELYYFVENLVVDEDSTDSITPSDMDTWTDSLTTTYTVTISLTGANAYDTDTFGVALYDAGADPYSADSIYDDGETISSGTGQAVMSVAAGTYDMYAIIDEDDDDDLDEGELYYFEEDLVVNGNTSDSITPSDMTVFDGTL